jgi:large conductance mechanosensitive channel protein
VQAWLQDFKKFLIQGNLLAVAFVIGGAFAALVTALVRDIITPIIAVIFGQPDFETLSFTTNGSLFRYGDFLCTSKIPFKARRCPQCTAALGPAPAGAASLTEAHT